ncbi:conserved repeat domain-containing protein [Roseivivax lentus]|uniref:Conserved repeat domain-containing protein n=1 Tax=Roseivivax lentus TaxID=633194 RepID=A0A1N7NXG1_9RHOB|nr:GEVED domain-containing protein [Roseivivax lentus]SIT03037.1 conserved repeat domain-containing protein [Roseivivax lentus]
MDTDGNPIDVVFQLNTVSGPTNIRFTDASNVLDANMRAADNSWLSFDVTMVRDGTATPANPQGTPIDLSRINGVVIQQVDIDSNGVNQNSSDVAGFLTGNPEVSYFNTVPWPSFPAPGQAIVMDPAKVGSSADWFDEPNESPFDNYVTYRYGALNTGTFLLGFTGTETALSSRGAGILLCTIADTSTNLVATDDDYGASPVNGGLGGIAGNVLDNDTVDLSPIDPVLAAITTIQPATPASAGDPVPYIGTDGLLEGQVVVPLFTPAGTYTIVYELCELIDPSNCDRATVTVAVDPALIDRGDAPASYGDAAHLIVPEIFLGADLPDSEPSASYSSDASGDDTSGIDDEDGIAQMPDLIAGETAELVVSVRESLNFDPLPPLFGMTFLNLWIDFDGNGVFGIGEHVAADVVNGGPLDLDGSFNTEIRLAVPVPAGAVAGPTIARLRWSTTSGLVSDDLLGFALDGEVEDYEVTIFTIPPEADLALNKAVQDTAGAPISEALAGTALDFVLRVDNAGPGQADGVVVHDRLPSGYAYVSDDAAAQGMSYDAATGLWQVGAVPSGASRSLTIRATLLAAGKHLNEAEIIESSVVDPDSDPGVGAAADDLGDGLADDDEASAGVTVLPGAATLSGTVFLDTGTGGAVAHDGLQAGTEAGTGAAIVTIFDAAGTILGTATPGADGTWSFTLPDGYADAVTLSAEAPLDHRVISETGAALPGRSLPDAIDGAITFLPDPGTDYAGLDIGLIREAGLSEGQEATIAPGQIVQLQHEYLGHSAGSVAFSVVDISQTPASSFSATLYLDPACDGTPSLPVTAPMAVTEGTRICLVARVASDSGIGEGAVHVFEVHAETSYTGTTFSEVDINTDRLTSLSGVSRLELSKTVENITSASGEGSRNAAAVGDVLEYRIYLRNTSTTSARDVTIYDRTPAYTRLAAPVPSPIPVGAALLCSLAEPAINAAGYAGDLRWECTGSYAPGESGAVSFRVEIAP